jgi:hypothetical protein
VKEEASGERRREEKRRNLRRRMLAKTSIDLSSETALCVSALDSGADCFVFFPLI